MSPVIVVLAFNRPLALRRLLQSLADADYPEGVSLIISLDGEANPDVIDISRSYSPNNLNVRVIEREMRLGLRNHVIACGDLSLQFGSVILLEDDLIVDRYFYSYASNALEYYDPAKSVAGIALYSCETSEASILPFRPMRNGYSTYLMRFPCSWGQCWTKSQWEGFRSWYRNKTAADLKGSRGLPEFVAAWPESSWKKYFLGYMVDCKLDFIYPYTSYSTNCSDEGGTHVREAVNTWQVEMATALRPRPEYDFCPENHKEVVYDAYFEPVGSFLFRTLDMTEKELVVDLQGVKPLSVLREKKYAVTPRCNKRDFNGVKERKASFSHDFRPPEQNLRFQKERYEEGYWFLVPSSSCCEKGRLIGSVESLNAYAGMRVFRLKFVSLFFKWLLSSCIKRLERYLKN